MSVKTKQDETKYYTKHECKKHWKQVMHSVNQQLSYVGIEVT